MFTQRKKGVKITDKRIRMTTEILQGIRLIKFYAWEEFYTYHIGELRGREIKAIRKAAYVNSLYPMTCLIISIRMARSLLIAIVTFIPIGASILSFVSLYIRLQIFGKLIHLGLLTLIDYLRAERSRFECRYHIQFFAALQRKLFSHCHNS